MSYGKLRSGALILLIVLFLVLSNAIEKDDAVPVMSRNDTIAAVEAFARSLSSLGTIEYKQFIKSGGSTDRKEAVEIHYYYKKPGYLRIDTKSASSESIDIYTPEGMYEYFPKSGTAYYREKWKDDGIITFQLNDKLEDIMVRGKYELFKEDNINGMDCEVIRCVDESDGSIYEHRIWMAYKNGFRLPVREEYLTDGDIKMLCEYEYISVNREISNRIFDIKSMGDVRVYTVEGIPKPVKDSTEAKRFVKFNVVTPEYIPEGFKLEEIYAIPPAANPAVLMSYISDTEIIQFRQKNTKKNNLELSEYDRVIEAEGRKFAVRNLSNNYVSVKWVKDGIEFEVSGPYTLKDEIVKLTQSVSRIWISVE